MTQATETSRAADLQTSAPEPGRNLSVPLTQLHASPTNPRKHFDQVALEELATSIGRHGVLQPLLVRPNSKGGYEIVAGERRFRAAKMAQRKDVPVIIRGLTDVEVLEIQLIENLQRADLGPLEEAEGYRLLIKTGKYDHRRIASRIGRSEKYVYDRMKLLDLTPEAKQLLLEERITAGHAILLARLKPADQKRAVAHGLFETETDLLFGPEHHGAGSQKARSVRQLDDWISKHVRFDQTAADPVLFPETAAALTAAEETKGKIVAITHEAFVHPDARGKEKVYGPRSWKRADGKQKSKTCDRSGVGVVIAGFDRGASFPVCVSKSCMVHFPAQAKRAKQRAGAAAKESHGPASSPASKPAKPIRHPMSDAVVVDELAGSDALALELCTAAAKATPVVLLRLVLGANRWWLSDAAKRAGIKIGGERGGKQTTDFLKTAKLSQLQAVLLAASMEDPDPATYVAWASALGVNLVPHARKARVEAFRESPGAYTGVCQKCGCVDEDACKTPEGPCAWVDDDHTKCSACFPDELSMARPQRATGPRRAAARYTDDQKAKVLEFARKDGLTALQVQKKFGVSPVNFYRWRLEASKPKKPVKK